MSYGCNKNIDGDIKKHSQKDSGSKSKHRSSRIKAVLAAELHIITRQIKPSWLQEFKPFDNKKINITEAGKHQTKNDYNVTQTS